MIRALAICILSKLIGKNEKQMLQMQLKSDYCGMEPMYGDRGAGTKLT